MNCPKCGDTEHGVIRTIRGADFDLREAYCKNQRCSHVFYQKIERISSIEFNMLKTICKETDKPVIVEKDGRDEY